MASESFTARMDEVARFRLPVSVKELAKAERRLRREHGSKLFMHQDGEWLVVLKPTNFGGKDGQGAP